MVGKTFDEWYLGKKYLHSEDKYSAELAWDYQQEQFEEIIDCFEEKLKVLNREHLILINKMKCCCNCGYDSKLEACDDCDETFKNWRMK